MNERAIIIASGQKNRLNRKHEGAQKVLETNYEFIIYEQDCKHLEGTKPGVNLPINYYEKIIGVVGITGNPKEVYNLAKIIKMNIELMLHQKNFYKQRSIQQRMLEEFVAGITNSAEWNYQKTLDMAIKLNISHRLNRAVLVIDIKEEMNLEKKDKLIREISMIIDNRSIVSLTNSGLIFIAVPFVGNLDSEYKLANTLCKIINQKHTDFKIGIGNRYKGLEGYRQSFFEAQKSIELARNTKAKQQVTHIEEWFLTRLLAEVPTKTLQKVISDFTEKIASLDTELIKTLEVFFQCNLDYKLTANKLYVHRNTVSYRLDRVKKILNLDCRKFNDAIMIKVLLIYYKLYY